MKTSVVAVSSILGVVLAAVIVSKPWVTIHHTKPIVVKGYAEKDVRSDSGSLTASVVHTSPLGSEAYAEAGQSLNRIKAIIVGELRADAEMLELKSQVSEVQKVDANGRRTNEVDFYRVSRQVRVSSTDVTGLARVGRLLFDLNGEGLRVNVSGPELFVSSLEDVKLELLSQATENGKKRAEVLASNSGERLGALVSARQGVIQITKKNSGQTSSYGIYDTETIDKVVKLVVTLEFEIKE